MPDRITSLVAPVRTCPLAGVPYTVYEARLIDLATLQSWVDARWPDPTEGLDERLAEAGGDPVARDKILFPLWGEVAEGPPVFDTGEGQVLLFGSPGGMAEFLRVVLARGNPGLTTLDFERLVGVVAEGSPGVLAWFEAVCRSFYGGDAIGLIKRLLGVPREMPQAEPLSWSEAVVLLAKEFGWTLDYILSLSVSQFMTCHAGGKPREHTLRLSHDLLKTFNDRRCVALYGEIPGEQVARPVG